MDYMALHAAAFYDSTTPLFSVVLDFWIEWRYSTNRKGVSSNIWLWFAAGGSKSIKIIAFASEPLVVVYLPRLPKQQLAATKI